MPAVNARSLKCTVVLDPAEVAAIPVKDGLPRVLLRIRLPDRTVTADLNAKSVRRAQAAVREYGADGVAADWRWAGEMGGRLMVTFKKTVATAKTKIAKADAEAFAARLEAIAAILQDAAPHDVLTLCVHAIAEVAPTCCEAHQDEFGAELLRVLSDCVAIRQEQEAAEVGGDDEARTSVH